MDMQIKFNYIKFQHYCNLYICTQYILYPSSAVRNFVVNNQTVFSTCQLLYYE